MTAIISLPMRLCRSSDSKSSRSTRRCLGFLRILTKISTAQIQKMNYAVDGQHRDPRNVVREFLQETKLVP